MEDEPQKSEERDLLIESLRKNLEDVRKNKLELEEKEQKIIKQINKLSPDEQVE